MSYQESIRADRHKFKRLQVVLALVLLIGGLGCASKEEKIARHLDKARKYVEASEYRKAVIEFKNVIQLDSENDEAYYELGETYLKLKQGQDAFQAFSHAVSINPENLKAQLMMGQVLLLGKKTEAAREKSELILNRSPGDVEALVLLSGVQVQEGNTASAIKTLEKAVTLDPEHFRTHLMMARLYYSKGDFAQAESAYLKAISLEPESRVPYIELSHIYSATGQWDKAESEIEKMIEASGATAQNLFTLARFYERQQKWDLAEKTYLRVIDASSPEDIIPLMNLGAYYNRRKDYKKALNAMEKALSIKKGDLTVLLSIAQLHFDHNHIGESEEIVDKALEKDAGHVWANFLKGRIYLHKKEFSHAVERFSFVVRESPDDPYPYYYRALAHLGKREKELAKQDLLKAVELNAKFLDARLILAELYLREREQDLAREQIVTVLNYSPKQIRALMLKGSLNMMAGDMKTAEDTFRNVVALDPAYVPGYVRLGLLYNLTKRRSDALKCFEKALELDPQQTDALAMMVDIYMKEEAYDKAFKICEREKKRARDNPAHLALIEYLQGGISLAKKNIDKAQKHFEKAIDTEPNILSPYIALAKTFVQEKKLPQAIAQYEAIVKKNPDYLAGYMALGTIHSQQGDSKKAEEYYRKALQIKSDFAPAANNLAWTLARRDGNIDEALGFAQIAKEQMPKNAAVMDTLGWIYYLKGSYLNAIGEFQDSLAREPNNPIINYHTGLAYYKNNQSVEAKKYLEEALKIDQNFDGAEEARSILNKIKALSASS